MITHRRKKSRKLTKLFDKFLKVGVEFLHKTSLHGFHWVAETKEKQNGQFYYRIVLIIWLVSVVVCLFFALFLMALVWKRYAISPTITTIETNNYPISNVPFPGVTICNINSVYKPYALDIIKQLKLYGITKKNAKNFLSNLSSLINHKEIDEEYIIIFDILVKLGYNASKLMLKLARPCKRMLKSCFWLGKPISCREYFRTTITGFGYCRSFNYQALRNDLETDNLNNLDEFFQINTPLIRTSGAGEDFSLRVILDVEADNYLAPKRLFYGTEIIIHDPEEFPTKTMLTAFGQKGTDVSIAVRTSVVESVKEVAKLPVNLRFCRFSFEMPLKITKKYTFQSCITECRAKTMVRVCKCLPFHYPLPSKSNDNIFLNEHRSQVTLLATETIRQCGLRDVNCLNENKHVFSSLLTTQRQPSINTSASGMLCDCLPSCSEQNYGADTFISNRVNGVGNLNTQDTISNLSSIMVYFKDLSCIKYRRELFKTWDDFLASFGGIFGLCFEGSVISLIEILYYSTFKFVETYINSKGNERNIPEKKIQYTKPLQRNKSNHSFYRGSQIAYY